jgi:hypothetical protein
LILTAGASEVQASRRLSVTTKQGDQGGEAAYPSSPTIFWAAHWTALQTLHWKMS